MSECHIKNHPKFSVKIFSENVGTTENNNDNNDNNSDNDNNDNDK